MKKFVLVFFIGMLVLIIVVKFWNLMPTFLGGRWDVTKPNPITSNPITTWCNKLVDNAAGYGNVGVTIAQNDQPVSDLTVLLSMEKPPLLPYSNDPSGKTMIPFPTKACFINTNSKGMGTFKNVPMGTAYVFFNNDVAAYPKRFGVPNLSITSVEVKKGETTSVTTELNQRK